MGHHIFNMRLKIDNAAETASLAQPGHRQAVRFMAGGAQSPHHVLPAPHRANRLESTRTAVPHLVSNTQTYQQWPASVMRIHTAIPNRRSISSPLGESCNQRGRKRVFGRPQAE